MTVVKLGEEGRKERKRGGGGSLVILRRTADVESVDAWMLTVLAFKQRAVIACKWS